MPADGETFTLYQTGRHVAPQHFAEQAAEQVAASKAAMAILRKRSSDWGLCLPSPAGKTSDRLGSDALPHNRRSERIVAPDWRMKRDLLSQRYTTCMPAIHVKKIC